ncbi:hypothetical protein [Membranihabitans maritimus]|uniref:hypothetical protein n=1 Tax=Membranihabitans maritimus TaxID=2904244 RepID=UPI001F1A0874|nr:hypothetical protein [Membranihabitans maritimus]
MMKYTLITVIAVFILSSCGTSLRPFSENLIEEYAYDDYALENIQFYLSEPIVLTRTLSGGESAIDHGRITVKRGKKVEEIIFKEGTPGQYIFSPQKNHLAISFESNNDNYLIFGPIKNRKGIYRLLAKKWEEDYGTVSYNGKEYFTPASSAYATLLVDIKTRNTVQRRVKEVEGRTINQGHR